VIAVGYENGDVKLFNIDNSQYLWETHVNAGVCSIEFDGDTLRISTLAGAFTIEIESSKITPVAVSALIKSICLFYKLIFFSK
jgi:hypothetical protein